MYATRLAASIGSLFVFLAQVRGQAVISAHAGLIEYFEGALTLDGKPVAHDEGRWTGIPEGSRLSTVEGRAEVLLAPGVFLWMGPGSTITILRNDLEDPIVEVLTGSALVRSLEPASASAAVLIWGARREILQGNGVYRLNLGPEQEVQKLEDWAEVRRMAIESGNAARMRALRPQRARHNRARSGPVITAIVPGRVL